MRVVCGGATPRKFQTALFHLTTMNFLRIATFTALSVSAALAQVYVPGLRLTLTSNTPVMTSDVTGATTIYYTPYIGNNVITSNGTTLSVGNALQMTLTLNGYQSSGHIYDIFLYNTGVGGLTL